MEHALPSHHFSAVISPAAGRAHLAMLQGRTSHARVKNRRDSMTSFANRAQSAELVLSRTRDLRVDRET